MSAALPVKRVRYMDPAVWDAIREWGKDKGLEMADTLALLWQLQQEREQLHDEFVGRGQRNGDGGTRLEAR